MRNLIAFVVLNCVTFLFMSGCAEPMPIRAQYLPVDHAESWTESQPKSSGFMDDDEMMTDSVTDKRDPDSVLYEPEDGLDFITPPVLMDISEMTDGFNIVSQKTSGTSCPCPIESSIQPVVFKEKGGSARTEKRSARPVSGVVNINTAPVETLVLLPGIGPSLAERIVEHRAKRTFTQPAHLRRVKGIGRMKFEKLKGFVVVSGDTTITR